MNNSLAFPKMFSSNSTYIKLDVEAVRLNLELLLLSEKTSLFGDPNFGTRLKQIFFALNSTATLEIIADEITTAIATFMPLLRVAKNGITFEVTKTLLIVRLHIINILDYTSNIYEIALLQA